MAVYPTLDIILIRLYCFVTGYIDSTFLMHFNGYVLKPVKVEAIRKELKHLNCPPLAKQKWLIQVQCLGNFEVLADEKPLHFTREGTKELSVEEARFTRMMKSLRFYRRTN